MTHRDDCPDRWEARREGERAFEYGHGSWSNPYKSDSFGDGGCREAEREWEDSYRSARYDSERREEQLADERAAHRRAQEREQEQLECGELQVREQQDKRDYVVSMCSSNWHPYYGESQDGRPTCYCGDDEAPLQEGPQSGCADYAEHAKTELPT